jgi:bacteriocin biosynthesis cyclodehydratase domain-containing protein
MTAAYEVHADSRPRIRRDVLFTQTADGVLFHNAQGGFQLSGQSAYRFAALIVPHLDGGNSVADLCDGMPEKQRAMVTNLVGKLMERGFARNVAGADDAADPLPEIVRERFAPQINYIDHFQDGGPERFARFRAATIAVLGDDLVARYCAIGLVRNGAARVDVRPGGDALLREVTTEAAEAGAELGFLPSAGEPLDRHSLDGFDFVVCAGPDAPAQTFALLSAGVPAGVRVLPVTTVGGRAVVGPMSSADASVCWVCAMLRLGANGDGGDSSELWTRVSLPAAATPAMVPGRNLSAMLGNLLAYEIFRAVTGVLPAETDGRVIVQDLDSMDIVSERVLPHPRCPFCADGHAAADESTFDLDTEPAATSIADVDDTDDLLRELNERSVLVGTNTGLFTRFDDDDVNQTPLKVSSLVLGLGAARRRTITAFDVHHTAGARMRALRAAVGVYAEHVVPLATTTSDDLRRIEAADLVVASGVGGTTRDWVVATSLVSGDRVLVPEAAVHTSGPGNRAGVCTPTSAGTGVGATPAEAARAGLFSALCHDAVLRAIRRERGVTAVDLSTLDGDPELRFLTRSAVNLDVKVELLDLGGNVVLARIGGDGWAVAADTTWQQAATAALRDVLGAVQVGGAVDTGDPLVGAFDANTLVVQDAAAPDLAATVSARQVLDGLRDAGRDALVVSTTSDDLRRSGVAAVRVVLTS